MGYTRLFLLCLLSKVAMGNQVRPACPEEAKVCEFYLELAETSTMSLKRPDGSQVLLDIDSEGQVYQALNSCGQKTPRDDIDLSKVPLGDGSYKKVLLFNGTLPGPPIVVYEGQQVMVRLWNRLTDMGTTLHFHGLKQHNTPWMDGVSGVSQCDILPGERFTYRFLATPSGTHWYHSHYGSQRSIGAAGPIIVLERSKKTQPPNSTIFSDDFYVVVQDWYRKENAEMFTMIKFDSVKYPFDFETDICYNSTKQYDMVDSGVIPFVSALINGKGRYMGQDRRYPNPTFIPFEVFKVRKGGYFRFRVIGASMMFPLRVSVDNHPIHVIASDGNALKPQVMDSIIVYNGERYDFYIEANDPLNSGNYWLRATTLEIMQNGKNIEASHAKAILRYEGAPTQDPITTSKACTQLQPCHIFNCPYTSETSAHDNVMCHPITDFVLSEPEPVLEPEGDEDIVEYFLNFHFAFPMPSVTEKPTINGVQHMHAVASPMTYPDAPDVGKEACVFTSCSKGLCRTCHHRLDLPLNKTIQFNFVVTVNNAPGVINGNDHPVHIHGHSVQVLKVAYPYYHPVTKAYNKTSRDFQCTAEDCNTIVWTNKSWEGGRVPGLLKERAPLKDSFVIPVGGYTVVRFRTDNPGYWFMHCHVEFHNAEGMGLVIKAGDESQMNAKPRGMRTCSDFRYDEPDTLNAQATDEEMQRCIQADEAFKIPALVLGVATVFLTFTSVFAGCKYKLDEQY